MAYEFKLPDIGEGIAEGEIVQWLVKEGDTIREDQALVEVMTDKVTAEIPSPVSGVVQGLRAKPGEMVRVGAVIVVIDQTSATPTKPTETKAEAPVKEPALVVAGAKTTAAPQEIINGKPYSPAQSGKVLAAPATRKLARAMGIDLQVVTGSGPRGRVIPADLQAVSQGKVLAPTRATTPLSPAGGEERIPFAGMRRKIAEHLVTSKQTAPHFGYVEEVDMTELIRVREELLPDGEAHGVKLTYLPFIIKAVIAGLRQYPMLNAMLDEDKQEIVYKHYYNMGIAVATSQGLIVPVLKNAEQKGIITLAQEIKDLSSRAREGKLTLDELKGGTFTLTSIGSIGGLFGIPIINYPEVAILGINKISPRPVVRNGEIVIREMMHLSISCDHRVVDGAEAALFTKRVIELLEKPSRLLLEG